jgi:hypothetical protein
MLQTDNPDKIAILIDTKGPEIRTTNVNKPITVKENDIIHVKGYEGEDSSSKCIFLTYDHFVNDVNIGNLLLINDGEVELDDIDGKFFDLLEQLMPFGHGNSRPIFRFNDMEIIKCYPVGKAHCRGVMKSKSNHSINFIAFNRSVDEVSTGMFDVLATPELNDYFNEPKPQLHIHELRLVY